MLKRVALSLALFGTGLVLQPSTASAQERYYDHPTREYRRHWDRDRRYDERREHEWREHERREERRDWRWRREYNGYYGNGYYGGVYYYGAPAYGYYEYSNPCPY
jgi:hypothetical protein